MLEVRYKGRTYVADSVSQALAGFRALHGPTVYLHKTNSNRGWRAEIKRGDGKTYFLGDIKDPKKHVMTPALVRWYR